MKRTKSLRNTVISVGVFFAVAQLLAAGPRDGGLNSSHMPLRPAIITLNAPSVDALLLAMGHEDAATTFRHYHRVATSRAAKAFWSIIPTAADKRVVQFVTA